MSKYLRCWIYFSTSFFVNHIFFAKCFNSFLVHEFRPSRHTVDENDSDISEDPSFFADSADVLHIQESSDSDTDNEIGPYWETSTY